MPAISNLLDFHVETTLVTNMGERLTLQQDLDDILKSHGCQQVSLKQLPDGFLIVWDGPHGCFVTARGYSRGLLTLTIEEFVENQEKAAFNIQVLKVLEAVVKERVKSYKMKRLSPIKRGNRIDQYISTSDDRLLEYDFDEMLFEADSPYQNIKIAHSIGYGNVLILDDLQNLAESDLIYTHTLMRYGIEKYKGKSVLILGGGDGGLLHELLKEDPAHVTMIEIDQVVIDACKKHLRSVCGSCLDQLKGDNYEIIIDDCVHIMTRYMQEGKHFDYVISDLTDIPITQTPQGEFWDFIRNILRLSFNVLAQNGKFLTHGNGVGSTQALTMYENQLKLLDDSLEFRRHTAYVPSFMEMWVFYEVWRTGERTITNGE